MLFIFIFCFVACACTRHIYASENLLIDLTFSNSICISDKSTMTFFTLFQNFSIAFVHVVDEVLERLWNLTFFTGHRVV